MPADLQNLLESVKYPFFFFAAGLFPAFGLAIYVSQRFFEDPDMKRSKRGGYRRDTFMALAVGWGAICALVWWILR